MSRTLAEFYNGKTIFLTGAAGYVGIFLLETLLRCFPGIKCIYILLRPKKGMKPEERKKQILESVVMNYIRENCPENFEKIELFAGDISKPDLGMNDEDIRKVIEEVQIVFHCAAIVSFTNTYKDETNNNCIGTLIMLNLCKKIKNLQALIYTGTAYANAHLGPKVPVEEKFYELKYPTQRFLDELENGTEESFKALVRSQSNNYPNSYVFSKHLAESAIKDFSDDLPVVIVRPSIIIPPWKGPNKGYLASGLGFPNVAYAITRGIIRVVPASTGDSVDVIPNDIVANAHIIAAWGIATERIPQFFIINCTGGNTDLQFNMVNFVNDIVKIAQKNQPIPKAFQEPSAIVIENQTLYRILQFYEEYLPCWVLDMCLRYSGKKEKFVSMQERTFNILKNYKSFFLRSWPSISKNMRSLSQMLVPEDREMIYTDMEGATVKQIFELAPQNSTLYDPRTDYLSPKKRRHIILKRTMFITFIRRFTLLLIICIIYLIVSKLFF